MSLRKYTQVRLVVQRPDTSAYDALRAMEDNHVGAIIVCEASMVVGIVTDRDLAAHVIGYELDPVEVPLADIMSSPVVTLSVTASEADAARTMLERHIRRVPLLDGSELVGLVTLDDLILNQAVAPGILAAIVRAQLAEPSRLKARGHTHPGEPEPGTDAQRGRAARRYSARLKLAYDNLIRRTMELTGLERPERAEAVLEELLSGIIRRIQPQETRQLLAQLPTLLRTRLAIVPRESDRRIARSTIEQAVADRLGVDATRASKILEQVARALEQTISPGEIEDVRSQLPPDMKNLLPTAPHG